MVDYEVFQRVRSPAHSHCRCGGGNRSTASHDSSSCSFKLRRRRLHTGRRVDRGVGRRRQGHGDEGAAGEGLGSGVTNNLKQAMVSMGQTTEARLSTWPPMGSRFQDISVKEADTTA
jgi:hypothetical protein